MMHRESTVEYTFRLRQDVAADWTSINPVLLAGEPGVELDTGKMKVGDGITSWVTLPYYLTEPHIQELIDGAVIEGVPGDSAYEVAVDNGFVGTEVEWLASLEGTDGTNGTNGTNGAAGAAGISAYQVAVNNGFVGNEAAWLASLEGADGTNGTNGTNGTDGADGADGADGESVTVILVDFGDWPPASDSNPLHLYFRLPE